MFVPHSLSAADVPLLRNATQVGQRSVALNSDFVLLALRLLWQQARTDSINNLEQCVCRYMQP